MQFLDGRSKVAVEGPSLSEKKNWWLTFQRDVIKFQNMCVLIFLDIDGVLRKKDSSLYKLDKDCLQRFEETLRSFLEIEIVITSSWREAFNLAEIRKLFSPDIAQRTVGITPISQYLEDYHHYKEVLLYLRQNKSGSQKWIAIMGDPEHFPPLSNVIIVDPDRGFDSNAAQQLSSLLKEEYQHQKVC